jgi:hypothetical protein
VWLTMDESREASLEGDTDEIASSLADEYLQTDISGHVQDNTAWLIGLCAAHVVCSGRKAVRGCCSGSALFVFGLPGGGANPGALRNGNIA